MADTLDQRDHWEVDREFTLPHFGDLVTDGRVEHDTDDVETAYFDTAERDLHAFGMTVTRRVVDDAEWVLTMPGSSATLRFADSTSVPEELATITHLEAQHYFDEDMTQEEQEFRTQFIIEMESGTIRAGLYTDATCLDPSRNCC